jgi:hypothetical protein
VIFIYLKKDFSMKKTVFLSVVTTLLAGCAAGPKSDSYAGPTGETQSTIRCTKDTSGCFKKASETCNGGSYRVTNSYRNAGGLWADILPGPVTWYTMNIICGKSDGRVPDFPLRGSEPSMPPMPATPSSTQTTCYKTGNTVNCTSY